MADEEEKPPCSSNNPDIEVISAAGPSIQENPPPVSHPDGSIQVVIGKKLPPQRAPSARNRARQAARQNATSSAEITDSKTVDVVIDSVARGRPLHDPLPSWRRPKMQSWLDPSLKAAQEQLELEKRQRFMKQQAELHKLQREQKEAKEKQAQDQAHVHQPQIIPQQPHRIPQQKNPPSRMSGQYQYARTQHSPQSRAHSQPTRPHRSRIQHTQRHQSSSSNGPRGLLPTPPGIVQNTSADDHKFKKPLLPAKHRKISAADEEKKRREAMEDAERVQRHLQEAKRASMEAAQAKQMQKALLNPPRATPRPRAQAPLSRKKTFSPEYYTTTAPLQTETNISPEMAQQSDSEKQKVLLNQEFLEIPNVLAHSNFILRFLCNKQTFYSLSVESQQHLLKFLPPGSFEDLEGTLRYAFSMDPHIVKGNPVNTLHLRLRNGYYNQEKINELRDLRDAERVEYEHYLRMHHMKLFRRLIVSRRLLLQQYDTVHVENRRHPGPQPVAKDVALEKKHLRSLRRRAAKRSRMMMSDCRLKVGEQGLSSDEEDEDVGEPINKALQTTIFQRSTIYNPKLKDLDMWQPTKVDDVKTMLKKFKKHKRCHPKAPSLDFRGIEMDQVFDRAGILAQSQKIRETVAILEKNLGRANDPNSKLLFS